jgi:NADH-quinone oxidoreductase subunit C
LGAAAELVGLWESRGWTVAAPTEHPVQRVAESRWVAAAHLVEAVGAARAAGFFFESMTCIDRLDPHGVFELLYTFNRFESADRVALRVWAPKDEAVPSVGVHFGIAWWNEREAWELYGLSFSGHPNLTWLILPDDTPWRPLLKSFTAPPPSVYDGTLNRDGTPAVQPTAE